MKNKLKNLQKTMCLIETKGTNTILMAECLTYLEKCIQECDQKKVPEAPKSVED